MIPTLGGSYDGREEAAYCLFSLRAEGATIVGLGSNVARPNTVQLSHRALRGTREQIFTASVNPVFSVVEVVK
jgi:hypothetical protein